MALHSRVTRIPRCDGHLTKSFELRSYLQAPVGPQRKEHEAKHGCCPPGRFQQGLKRVHLCVVSDRSGHFEILELRSNVDHGGACAGSSLTFNRSKHKCIIWLCWGFSWLFAAPGAALPLPQNVTHVHLFFNAGSFAAKRRFILTLYALSRSIRCAFSRQAVLV